MSSDNIDDKKEMLKFKVGTNWTGNNITTLLNWISISSYNIECLEMAIDESRQTLRRNTIFALIVSTLAGTLNITQFNLIQNEYINIAIKILFTLLTFSVAINAGRIKIYQYQESLEDYIKIKQEWISFVVQISTELQLPVRLRRDALYLIETYKDKYLDLLKYECEISSTIKDFIKKKMEEDVRRGLNKKPTASNLHPALVSKTGIKISEIVFDIAYSEGLNLLVAETDRNYKPNKEINDIYDKITTKLFFNKKKTDAYTYIEEEFFEQLPSSTFVPVPPSPTRNFRKVTQKGTSVEFAPNGHFHASTPEDSTIQLSESPTDVKIDIHEPSKVNAPEEAKANVPETPKKIKIEYAPKVDESPPQDEIIPKTNPIKRSFSLKKKQNDSLEDLEIGTRIKTLE
jgi:hypothetical protein